MVVLIVVFVLVVILAVVLIVVLVVVFVQNIVRSTFGRAILAVREDEIAANSCGIHVFHYKMAGFVLASFVAGIGGALYVMYVGFIKPEQAALISNATALPAPRFFCTSHASPGRCLSADTVAAIMISTSSAVIPALFNAFKDASVDIPVVVSLTHKCLASIPVLDRIHSSEVSTIWLRSSFVIRSFGR